MIFPPFCANLSTKQSNAYHSDNKSRKGHAPLTVLVPSGVQEGTGWFNLACPVSVTNFVWYVMYSAVEIPEVFARRACGYDFTPDNIRQELVAYSTVAQFGNNPNNRITLWPSIIWEHMANQSLRLAQREIGFAGIVAPGPDDFATPIARLRTSWLATREGPSSPSKCLSEIIARDAVGEG
jgi:hypothetical protein